MEEYQRKGQTFFQALYGETAEGVQGLLDSIMPDMGMSFIHFYTTRL